MGFNVAEHALVSEHQKLAKEEKELLLEKYRISTKELPKILKSDVAIEHLRADPGDVIKIIRKSPTAGKATYYRVIIHG